ncbi:SDR family NAD(P)-dependent oxidoreductase [Sphingomonas sp. Root710]|uniref:SDR family NAD(P)-dependent oxidoreductase n=1 Tax=Sphingomonas sp. Root710 TaxID=1736594 RepID=UPI000AD4A4EF|nr:SDR family NAD(P)-dependent oxidoreductase [Sphingomonas sp. Root710]
MRIEGQVALVTGASGGIGAALVDSLLDAGAARVVACDVQEAALAALARRSPRIDTLLLDVTDEAAVAAAASGHPDVGILINCHGLAIQQSYLEAPSLAAFRREMEVNYWGQVLMCRAFAPVLMRAEEGALVNVLSPLAYVTFPFVAPYCATKAACRALTDAMRAEFAPAGALVIGVYPGNIDTAMMSNVDVPKSDPHVVAHAVVEGLRSGLQEVWAGASAEEIRDMLKSDPDALIAAAARQLRIANINAAGQTVSIG